MSFELWVVIGEFDEVVLEVFIHENVCNYLLAIRAIPPIFTASLVGVC